jgi:hypothetical protein
MLDHSEDTLVVYVTKNPDGSLCDAGVAQGPGYWVSMPGYKTMSLLSWKSGSHRIKMPGTIGVSCGGQLIYLDQNVKVGPIECDSYKVWGL